MKDRWATMAKSYPAGGPIEAIRGRWSAKGSNPLGADEVLRALMELDSYYRERLDSYAVAVTELRDIIRKGGN